MQSTWRLALVVGAGVLAASPAVVAQDEDEDAQPSVKDLIERIEKLEEDKSEMKGEIAELQSQLGDNWMTERRADEIKTLVADVLADADSRSSLQDAGLTAGWNGNFFLASPDGKFKLQLDGLLQFRFNWNYHDAGTGTDTLWGFEFARAKLTFRGHAFTPDLEYLVRINAVREELQYALVSPAFLGTYYLQDAWIRYNMSDEWSVRLGQFKLPFAREELVAPSQQLVIERSLVNETMNLGRSQGIEILWALPQTKLWFSYNEGATDVLRVPQFLLTNGNFPMNSPWSLLLAEYSFTSRFEWLVDGNWRQFQDLTSQPGDEFGLLWGIAAHYQVQRQQGLAATTPPSLFAFTTDVSAEWGGATLFASFNYDYVQTQLNLGGNATIANIWGVVVQGGLYFTEKLEGYARFEWGKFDLQNNPFPDLYVLTLGCNYYFEGNDVKLSADVGWGFDDVARPWASDIAAWRRDPPGSSPQVVIRTQLQLVF